MRSSRQDCTDDKKRPLESGLFVSDGELQFVFAQWGYFSQVEASFLMTSYGVTFWEAL